MRDETASGRSGCRSGDVHQVVLQVFQARGDHVGVHGVPVPSCFRSAGLEGGPDRGEAAPEDGCREVGADLVSALEPHVGGLEVDLHFDLLKLGIPTRQSSEVWNLTSAYLLPGGGSVRVLDDTTALAHLLVHLNKDRFQRLLGYADIARIIARGQVDWERLERFARGEGIIVSTFRTLEVVLGEFSLPWPVELERLVQTLHALCGKREGAD